MSEVGTMKHYVHWLERLHASQTETLKLIETLIAESKAASGRSNRSLRSSREPSRGHRQTWFTTSEAAEYLSTLSPTAESVTPDALRMAIKRGRLVPDSLAVPGKPHVFSRKTLDAYWARDRE